MGVDPRVEALYYLYLLPDVNRRNFKNKEVWKVMSNTVIDILSYNKYEMAKAILKSFKK